MGGGSAVSPAGRPVCGRSLLSPHGDADRSRRVADRTPGDRGSLVWTVQRLLKARRQPVRLTGIFDTETKSRVVAFQHDSGLQPDGLVGARTWSMLVMATSPGDTGPQVEAVQNPLAHAGWPADITGHFTTATHQSLLGFQREHGLPATGTADAATLLALSTEEPRP
ncbi:peptidoglycan-binding domain-containing protein [Streptomyces puniciscabiei]